ncbi:MAG TPA: nuclear transport factor 2 family protein [Gemmatimonadales bacterium]
MTDDANRELVERYLRAYDTFDVPGMLATLDPDVEFRNVSNGEVTVTTRGIDEFRALAEQSAKLFHSRSQTLVGYEGEGDRATVHIDYEGVLAVDLSPELRAGEMMKLTGRSTFGFRDGRISLIVDES